MSLQLSDSVLQAPSAKAFLPLVEILQALPATALVLAPTEPDVPPIEFTTESHVKASLAPPQVK